MDERFERGAEPRCRLLEYRSSSIVLFCSVHRVREFTATERSCTSSGSFKAQKLSH